jgi:hypothetical protein
MDALGSILTRLEVEGSALGYFNVSDLVLFKAVLAFVRSNRGFGTCRGIRRRTGFLSCTPVWGRVNSLRVNRMSPVRRKRLRQLRRLIPQFSFRRRQSRPTRY